MYKRQGIYRFEASSLGYTTVQTPEYMVSTSTPSIWIEMEENENLLSAVVVTPSPFRRRIESPVSMQVIGRQEIEKSPVANRDVSRIVRAYPCLLYTSYIHFNIYPTFSKAVTILFHAFHSFSLLLNGSKIYSTTSKYNTLLE